MYLCFEANRMCSESEHNAKIPQTRRYTKEFIDKEPGDS